MMKERRQVAGRRRPIYREERVEQGCKVVVAGSRGIEKLLGNFPGGLGASLLQDLSHPPPTARPDPSPEIMFLMVPFVISPSPAICYFILFLPFGTASNDCVFSPG